MDAMKTSVGKLYMLFDACLPQNENVKKRLNICKITESSEYNELKGYTSFSNQFKIYFSKDKLSEYSAEELEKITKAIPKIIPLLEKLNTSIQRGNAPELTEKDIPDFTSAESLDELSNKLKFDAAGSNITNITQDNLLAIFSDKTVKEPSSALKYTSATDVKEPVKTVKRNLGSALYCIKIKDIEDANSEYAEKVSSIQKKIADVDGKILSIRFKKWFFIALAIALLIIINSYEFVSADRLTVLTALSSLLIIIYLFIG